MKHKRCPFCGSTDVFVERADFTACFVQCNGCCARGPLELQHSDTEETPGARWASRSWNRRSNDVPQRGDIETPLERAFAEEPQRTIINDALKRIGSTPNRGGE